MISGEDINEELAMEMATALLLVESIVDDFNQPSTDLPQQVEAVIARLQQVTLSSGDISGELHHLPFNIIDNRKQEKELLTQIAQEIQANLGLIENTLDAFFFEPEKRPELSKLATLFKQISGAFVVLELERANKLLDEHPLRRGALPCPTRSQAITHRQTRPGNRSRMGGQTAIKSLRKPLLYLKSLHYPKMLHCWRWKLRLKQTTFHNLMLNRLKH